MKTTVILKDDLLRRAKSRAALRGWSLSRYLEWSLEKSMEGSPASRVGDWLDALPPVPAEAREEVEAILKDADFNKVDEEMWR